MWLSSPHGDWEWKSSPSLHVSPTLVRTEINEPNRGVQQLSWHSQTRTVGKRTEWRQSAMRREEIHVSHTYSSQQSNNLINMSEKHPSLFLSALSLLPLHSRQTIKLLYFFSSTPMTHSLILMLCEFNKRVFVVGVEINFRSLLATPRGHRSR